MRRAPAAVLVVVLVVLAGGCSSGGRDARGVATVAPVVERDFKITARRYALPAGEVDLSVTNRGPNAHELLLVRETESGLPMTGDGLSVDERAIEHEKLGELRPGQPGGMRHMRVRLAPGRYVLLCNMAGHYMGGMHTELVVT